MHGHFHQATASLMWKYLSTFGWVYTHAACLLDQPVSTIETHKIPQTIQITPTYCDMLSKKNCTKKYRALHSLLPSTSLWMMILGWRSLRTAVVELLILNHTICCKKGRRRTCNVKLCNTHDVPVHTTNFRVHHSKPMCITCLEALFALGPSL